ncbi:MAG TPA: hypothetical protein VFL81_03010 [Candidatus Saccharimonadales bacterium]|nr:hypothetical protein [Candidatus Saccharimonadales bacterium]
MSYEADRIAVRNNSLLVNGELLAMKEASPDELSEVLELGRTAIINGIESSYEQTKTKNPGAIVKRPSILSLVLTNKARTEQQKAEFLSRYGLMNRTGLYRHRVEVTEQTEPYWSAVERSGFKPEVRATAARVGRQVISSLYMAIRNPETDAPSIGSLEHLPEALGFRQLGRDTLDYQKLKQAYEGDSSGYEALLDHQQDEGQARVDADTEFFGHEIRPYAQIGLIIAKANLRLSIEGPAYSQTDSYRGTLEDAEEYAFQMGYDEISDLIKVEIERLVADK